MAHKKKVCTFDCKNKTPYNTKLFKKQERKEKTTKTIIPLFDEKKKTT